MIKTITMFSKQDEIQIKERGSDIEKVKIQIESFKKGFPFLKIEKAATPDDGIIQLDDTSANDYGKFYDNQTENAITPLKFVPASGAASRMFKALYEALEDCKKYEDQKSALARNASAREFLVNKEKF